jgi:hypothetical protein
VSEQIIVGAVAVLEDERSLFEILSSVQLSSVEKLPNGDSPSGVLLVQGYSLSFGYPRCLTSALILIEEAAHGGRR